MSDALLDAALSTVPALVLAAVTWRVVWPRWKLVGKLVLHPSAVQSRRRGLRTPLRSTHMSTRHR